MKSPFKSSNNYIVYLMVISMVLCMCSCGSGKNNDNSVPIENIASGIESDTFSDHNSTPDNSSTFSEIESKKSDTETNSEITSADTSLTVFNSSSAALSSSYRDTSSINSASDSSFSSQDSTTTTTTYIVTDNSASNNNKKQTESKNATQNGTQSGDNNSTSVQTNPNNSGKRLVVIDAGHQRSANLEQEPIGPGSGETKMKVSGGTAGRTSGKAEYELTLELALQLQSVLEERGYEVIQVRTSHDVNISNSERSAIANNAGADAFVRIHANGSDNTSQSGAMTICQSASNPYNGNLYERSKALSSYVLDELVAATNCNKEYVWETDTMSGINWATVPVTIVEVGYMSNPQEDLLLASADYQEKIVDGISNGLDLYFSKY